MKKAARIISLAMAVMMLVSCAPKTSGSMATSTGDNPDATIKTNAQREKVNVRFSQFANSTDDPAGMKNDPIKKYIEDTVNITLEYDGSSENYIERMTTELAVGAAPDLFCSYSQPDLISKWVEEEAVVDIGAIVNAEPERYPVLFKIINTPEYKAYNKSYLGDENKTYAIYSVASLAYPMYNGIPAYNKEALEKFNSGKVPATVQEFVDFTKKAGAGGMSGWWPYNNKLTNMGELDATIAGPMGTTILPPFDQLWQGYLPEGTIGTDEKWVPMTTSDKSKEVIKVLADMYKNNGLHNGIGVLSDDDDGYSQFADGRIASFSYGYGYYTQFHKIYESVWKKAHSDAKIGDVVLGTGLNVDGNWYKRYDTGSWMGWHYFIPASSKAPDRVLDLVEYIASKEGQKTIFRGVEGLTYTMDGDKVVYNMDEFVKINKAYGYADRDRCRYMWFSYLFSGGEMMLNLEDKGWWESVTTPFDNTVEWATDNDKEIYDYAIEQIAKTTPNVYNKLPAYYNFAALPSELADIRAKLKDISQRYLSAMIGGQMDIEKEWPNYIKEYEAAGIAKVTEAVNKAVTDARATYKA